MPVTFPVSYGIDPKNLSQGPTRLWYAPYVSAGADPAQGNIVAFGALTKDGIEFDHKLTYVDTEADQSTFPIDSFLSKQEIDIKATLEEVSDANLNIALGAQPGSLTSGGGIGTQQLGEYFDIQAGNNPSMRPPYRQWIFQFASPGHDNQTSPIGAWAYIQLYKAFVSAHSVIKFHKDGLATVQITVKAVADFTVSGAYKVGKKITQ